MKTPKTTKYITIVILSILSILPLTSTLANSFSITEENDLFNPIAKSDNQYTQGAYIQYNTISNSYGIQQNIYTPNDISTNVNQPDDRPYAGLLLFSYKQILNHNYYHNIKITPSYTVYTGFSGEYSFAEEAQTTIHEWTGSTKPQGWNNQIPTEPILNVNYNYTLEYDRINHIKLYSRNGIDIGNALTRGQISIGLKTGIGDIHDDFSDLINLKNYSNNLNQLFLFTECIQYAVAHNISIDGSLFQSNPPSNIDATPFVSEIRYGIGIYLFNSFAVQYGLAYRTKEFETGESVDYGFIQLEYFY